MSIKSIFVPISGAGVDRGALEAAYVVARRFAAHIEGLDIASDPGEILQYAHSRLDKTVYQQALRSLEEQAAAKVEEVRQMFDDFIAQKGLEVTDDPANADHPTVSWQVAVGKEAEIVGQIGGAYDLVVVSHPAKGAENPSAELLDSAIFNTGRPVLLAPASVPPHLGDSIVVGWNRGVQAGRAVFAAMPFLERAKQVVIVTVTTGAKRGPTERDIARNLAWRGINAQVREIAPDYRNIGEILLFEAEKFGADMLVMGAFSQSRIRERVIGGVTKQILADAELPVLMAR